MAVVLRCGLMVGRRSRGRGWVTFGSLGASPCQKAAASQQSGRARLQPLSIPTFLLASLVAGATSYSVPGLGQRAVKHGPSVERERRGECNESRSGVKCFYFAEDEATATAEYERHTRPLRQAFATFFADVKLAQAMVALSLDSHR